MKSIEVLGLEQDMGVTERFSRNEDLASLGSKAEVCSTLANLRTSKADAVEQTCVLGATESPRLSNTPHPEGLHMTTRKELSSLTPEKVGQALDTPHQSIEPTSEPAQNNAVLSSPEPFSV